MNPMKCIGCGETMERVGEGWECPECGLCLFEFEEFDPHVPLPQRIEADFDIESGTFIAARWVQIDLDEADIDDTNDNP